MYALVFYFSNLPNIVIHSSEDKLLLPCGEDDRCLYKKYFSQYFVGRHFLFYIIIIMHTLVLYFYNLTDVIQSAKDEDRFSKFFGGRQFLHFTLLFNAYELMFYFSYVMH